MAEKYIKGEVRKLIKNAYAIFLYGEKKISAIYLEKGQDWSEFIKQGLREKEYNRISIYDKNKNKSEIEVTNAV